MLASAAPGIAPIRAGSVSMNSARRGQPPKPPEDVKSSHIHIKLTARQKAGYVKQAQDKGLKLSAWAIRKMDAPD